MILSHDFQKHGRRREYWVPEVCFSFSKADSIALALIVIFTANVFDMVKQSTT